MLNNLKKAYDHAKLIIDSYERLTGKKLLEEDVTSGGV